MADVEKQPDSSFPVKRKQDLCCQEQDNVANKAQKLNNPSSIEVEVNGSGVENLSSSSTDEKIGTESSSSLEQEGGEEDEDEEEVDRKGKGISREDKGKGKLIELDESDDSDGGEYDESDFSDDPLAEVDLDNILPSRTRRRSFQ